jgi:hypothetical protein
MAVHKAPGLAAAHNTAPVAVAAKMAAVSYCQCFYNIRYHDCFSSFTSPFNISFRSSLYISVYSNESE